MRVTLQDVRRDWRVLDERAFEPPPGVRLVSHEEFTSVPELPVEYVPPGRLSRWLRFVPWLAQFLYALRLLRRCGRQTVLILNGSGVLYLLTGLLNRLLFRRKRRILCWDIFVEVDKAWKRRIIRAALHGVSLCVVWSKFQVASHASFLQMREDRFVFIPYKANHSKGPRYELPVGNFVFSGGNGKRDYATLIEAVRGTGIPVIISATDPVVRKSIEPLPNVVVLAASEPAFAQLQAASQFVVIPMVYTAVKGGGEANFCNGQWHGKPVIAADSIAAANYIVDGETGYVVPSGDWQALHQRIVELWNDPEKVTRMGEAARRHAEENFTHLACIRRLLRLGALLGQEQGAHVRHADCQAATGSDAPPRHGGTKPAHAKRSAGDHAHQERADASVDG